eukprot:g22014.t1
MKIKSTASLVCRRCAEFLRSPGGQTSVAGLLTGFYLLVFGHQILATFGTSLVAVTAVTIAIAVGLEFGLRESRATSGDVAFFLRLKTRHCLLAAWVLAFPWLIQWAMSVASLIPAEVMASPGRLLLFQTLAALVLLTPPVFLLARTPILLFQSFETSTTPASTQKPTKHGNAGESSAVSRWNLRARLTRIWNWAYRDWNDASIEDVVCRYLMGTVSGLSIGILLIAPWLGVVAVAVSAASGSLMIAGVAGYRWWRRRSEKNQQPRIAVFRMIESRQEPPSDAIWHWLSTACLGGLLAVVLRMISQLAAAASFLVYIEWTVILFGVALGVSARFRNSTSRTRICIGIATWAVLGLALYGLLTETSLMINAYLSQPWLLMSVRILLFAIILTPFGFAWGRLATDAVEQQASNSAAGDDSAVIVSRLPALQTFAFTAGFLSTRWVAFPRWATADLLWALVWTIAGMAAIRTVARRRLSLPRGRSRRALLAASVAILLAVPFVRNQYDPVRTARQLFATNVFVARMRGLDSEELSFLDEGRNIARHEGERGTLTVWRYRGNQLQIRESGVPKAIVSTKPRLCPHFSAEVMQAVMPLALHERPERVMVLGLGGGVPLTTSLSFPVLHVTCVESDRELVSLLQKTVWSEARLKPLTDARLQYLPIDPAMAVACRGGEYDVVISSPDQSALLQTTPYFTRGFYQGVSRQLAEGGIFCQRFHQVDYGPMPLQTTVKTLQSVFRHVAAIEIAAGEMALLATNSEKGLSREGLVSRFRAPNVCRTLAEIGWDWSIPLNLTAYGHEGLREFADATPTPMNTIANGRLAFRLPQEVMRWGPKRRELAQLITPHGSRFAESKGIDSRDPEFLRRLSEVTGQRKLMVAFPDQWWAYRKSLKKQIRERPRTLIQKVSANSKSGRFHPEDRRRMRYIDALDLANKETTPARISRVSSFEEPYDPLLSYFVHQEAAELYGRSKQKDDQEELRHRLHAVYFANPHDRSVRNVASAINLIAKRPGATETPIERWDQLNALMQIMKGRWALRGLVKPKSISIVLNDIDNCLQSVTVAIQTMDAIRTETGIPLEDWDARRRVLKRGLIRPLKTYRAALLSHHLSERHKLKKLLDSLNDPAKKEPLPGLKIATQATRTAVGKNTNLGTILLLAPLASAASRVAEQLNAVQSGIPLSTDGSTSADLGQVAMRTGQSIELLKPSVVSVLNSLTREDAVYAYQAIRLAQPGGMGTVDRNDIRGEPEGTFQEIMRSAADRDLVAAEYSYGYRVTFDTAVPLLARHWPSQPHNWENHVIRLQLNLMAIHLDSLIIRKCGHAIARDAARRARDVLDSGWPDTELGLNQYQEFDAWLRADGNRRNPGTTADLIAAALFTAFCIGVIDAPPASSLAFARQ